MLRSYCERCGKSLDLRSGEYAINFGFCSRQCLEFTRERKGRNRFGQWLPKFKNTKAAKKNDKLRRRAATRLEYESFYKSKEWITLRYKVFKKYGRQCMSCGTQNAELHVDHIKPRSTHRHLELEFGNLQILCRDCNFGKGKWDSTDWRQGAMRNQVLRNRVGSGLPQGAGNARPPKTIEGEER